MSLDRDQQLLWPGMLVGFLSWAYIQGCAQCRAIERDCQEPPSLRARQHGLTRLRQVKADMDAAARAAQAAKDAKLAEYQRRREAGETDRSSHDLMRTPPCRPPANRLCLASAMHAPCQPDEAAM